MTKHAVRIISATITAIFAFSVCATFVVKQTPASADAPMTSDQLKSLYSEKCSACHDLPDPEEKGYTKPEWRSTVNRMLTANGAATSISPAQASEIVDYLGQFAPALPVGPEQEIGVWQNDPVASVSYPFTYAANLRSFDIHGGAWRIIETPDITSGYLKHESTDGSASLLIENKTNISDALDLQTQFHITQPSVTSEIGLVFGETDEKNYLDAVYQPSHNTVTFNRVTDGHLSQLDQATVDSSPTATPDGWHTIRVKVTEGGAALEVLFDYSKAFMTAYPTWQGGRVGLISNGPVVAGFRQLTIDEYSSAAQSPVGNVLIN